MSLIRHSFAAAALLILLGAGTSCERKSSAEKNAAPNPAIAVFIREGDAAKEKGRFAAAYRKALALCDKAGDPKSWCITATRVALMHMTLAAWKDAAPLLTEILSLREKHCGLEASETAETLNNLAHLLQATSRLAEAEPLLRRALPIEENSKGKEHPHVAISLNNLAQLLKDTNRMAEAEPLMRRALAIDEASFGKDHPDVALRLNNLAQLLHFTDRLAEAEPLLRRALAIWETSLGENHPQVAAALNNLAQLLKDTGRLEEAEPLMRRALAISEASFGKDHPTIALRLNNLADLLKATNRLAEAEQLLRRAVDIYVASSVASGHSHPNLEAVTNNYRDLLIKMGDTEAQAREKIIKILTPDGVTSEALEKIREGVPGK